MHYRFTFPHRVSRFAEIELTIEDLDGDELHLQLPSWRPGRYELGNFAKNIRGWKALDDKGNLLPSKKISKDSWVVQLEGAKKVTVRYEYYCSQADAGACWVDEEMVYINPIHCCLYVPERLPLNCRLEVVVPDDHRIACSLEPAGKNTFVASSYHELVDSPFIASPSLRHKSYETNGLEFHIWFQGNVNPDWEQLISDFKKFTEEQLRTMGSLPVPAFHFLILVLPYSFYHGVEHLRSTVLALGPGHALMNKPLYDDLTGVASHELFHVWNVKTIRPADMMPYDYTAENYSRLGFVYEGVTTYYGDLFLARAGVYSSDQFFTEINQRLQKHFDNYGRLNLPVAEASFDTWLDGYVPGIPHRKTSIYDEGCLTALMTDFLIRRQTQSKVSLDDVMRALYNDFGKTGIGYTEGDYIALLEHLSGTSFTDFFMDFVYGTENYEPLLSELLDEAGCELVRLPAKSLQERTFGFKTAAENGFTRVTAVAPGSLADKAGIGKDDEVIAVDEQKVQNDLSDLLSLTGTAPVVIDLITPMKRIRQVQLKPGRESYYHQYKIRKKETATPEQQRFFKAWLKQEFYA